MLPEQREREGALRLAHSRGCLVACPGSALFFAMAEEEPEAPQIYWFNVKYGEDNSALFNMDCWAIVLIEYIKERCGYADLLEPAGTARAAETVPSPSGEAVPVSHKSKGKHSFLDIMIFTPAFKVPTLIFFLKATRRWVGS